MLSRLPPIPTLLLSMLIIQSGSALSKGLFPLVGPAGAATLRVSLAALMLLLVFRPRWRGLSPAAWRAVVPYGAALGLMNLTFYQALARLPLGLAVTLEFVGPLALSLLLSRRAGDVLWVLLAALGVVMIAPHGTGALDPLGLTYALLAGGCWALYILMGGAVGRELPGGHGVALGMLVAALVTLLPGALQAGAALWQPRALLLGLGVAILSSALPYTLEMVALRAIPPRIFGVLMSLEPVVAALSSSRL